MPDALKKVDLVVLIDTSASMKDEAEALSKGMVTAIEDAKKACPSDLRVQFLGIEGTFASTEFTKTARQHLTGIGVDAGQLTARPRGKAKDSSAQEQIAQTVVDLSRHFDWRVGAERALFVLGDESLDGGGLTIGPKASLANDRAIEAALAAKVKVHAYQTTLPAQPTPEQAAALTKEYKRLALRTGGEYYIHTQGLADFRKVLQDAICASQVPVDDSIGDKSDEADTVEKEASAGAAHGQECTMCKSQTGIVQLNGPGSPVTKGGDLGAFTSVTFPKPYPAGSKVIVIPMVQTFNGPDTPGIRIADVTPEGFKIRINELVQSATPLSDGNHTTETIAWLACLVE
ncbi:hypothetical protein ACFW16_14880 [Inquilinus sp. NPDC058860]|uniref:hypothetical protein n=1 Tax=Inquilinus sp. NPDC058860 TaxID=3346652 RepID=UPI003681B04D